MEVKHLGNIYGEKFGKGYAGNVWEKQGIRPTLTTMQGGGREPMIIEDAQAIRMVRTEEGKALRKNTKVVPSITDLMSIGNQN